MIKWEAASFFAVFLMVFSTVVMPGMGKAAQNTITIRVVSDDRGVTRKVYEDIGQTLGFVPSFMRLLPEEKLAQAWQEFKALELSSNAVLPDKYRSLISLAVSSQMSCRNCSYWARQSAKKAGATEGEMAEAVAMANLANRRGSALSKLRVDEPEFRRDVDRICDSMQRQKQMTQKRGEE